MMEKEKMAPVDIDKLDKDTVEQSHCSLWHSEHIGRITSSTMHQVYRHHGSRAPDKLVASLLGIGSARTTKMKKDYPRMHGHECEPEARQAYIDRKASARFQSRSMA